MFINFKFRFSILPSKIKSFNKFPFSSKLNFISDVIIPDLTALFSKNSSGVFFNDLAISIIFLILFSSVIIFILLILFCFLIIDSMGRLVLMLLILISLFWKIILGLSVLISKLKLPMFKKIFILSNVIVKFLFFSEIFLLIKSLNLFVLSP